MGNLKGLARGSTSAKGGAPGAEDPFAELEQLFQSELNRDPRVEDAARRQNAATARREPGMDFAFDDLDKHFQTAFEAETRGQGRQAAPEARRDVAPKPVRKGQGAARAIGSRPIHPTDEEIDHELEEVLRNLSAPARPRDRIVVETQSFAPERAAEERIVHQPQADVDEFEELIRSELAVIRPTSVPAPRQAQRAEPAYEEAAYHPGAHPAAYETDYSAGPMEYGRPVTTGRRWKGRMMAGGSVLAVLVAGGLGVFLLHGASGGIGGSDEPLLIKADAEPYKIAPKDPGGRAYPNQNKAVYDRVASPNKADATPTQTALLRNAEEPMELPKEEEGVSYSDALPGVELGEGDGAKDETRVTAETEATDGGPEHVLQPRRVKTMRVGADGRLVPNEEPAAGTDPIATAAASVTDVASVVAEAAGEARDPVQVAAVPARPAAMPAPRPAPAPAPAPEAPVQAAAAMPTGGYFVQIASQPSEASAQQSMSSMGSRFASVIAGRPMGIQAAEIPGKGTYYRVRVAASSKDEAASLCSKLKSAGATCLVTR